MFGPKSLPTLTGLLDNQQAYEIMTKANNPYGDGKICQRIINIMKGLK